MDRLIKTIIDGKQVAFFKSEVKNAPILYANMYIEAGRAVLDACERLECRPFHLVSISKWRWDEDLSPWAHEPVVSKSDHFTGEADRYLLCLTEQIIPFVEETIKKPFRRIIAGYSMGGLFALYAPYMTDVFSGAVPASGPVWYPVFVTYAGTHDFLKKPDAIYLSLGDLESHTKNKTLSQTEHCMEKLYSICREKSIRSIFELNQGNHYKGVIYRLAKGITWIFMKEMAIETTFETRAAREKNAMKP